MTGDEREALAKKRFFLLSAMRFASIVFVMLGIANIGGRFVPEASPTLGYGFLIIGTIHFFLMPSTMKKIWARQDAGHD
ncbi:MAG: hypothetical protein ACRCY3_01830 [Sphingorhabdus sp.]